MLFRSCTISIPPFKQNSYTSMCPRPKDQILSMIPSQELWSQDHTCIQCNYVYPCSKSSTLISDSSLLTICAYLADNKNFRQSLWENKNSSESVHLKWTKLSCLTSTLPKAVSLPLPPMHLSLFISCHWLFNSYKLNSQHSQSIHWFPVSVEFPVETCNH